MPFTVTGAPTASLSPASMLGPTRRQLRRLEHDRAVDVARLPAGGPHVGHGPPQQVDAVGPGPRGVGVGEVLADVAEPGRAEERVGDGVGDHVGVAVAGQAALAGERHAAEHERPPRVVGERVDVEALPDPHRHRSSANDRSTGVVIFRFAGSPSTSTTLPPAASTSEASSVASAPVGVRGAQGPGPERLRRLHRHEALAVHGVAVDGGAACR